MPVATKVRDDVEPAITLTLPQLRVAVAQRLRENRKEGHGPTTRYALALALGSKPAQVYMVLAGHKRSRQLRVQLEWFALSVGSYRGLRAS